LQAENRLQFTDVDYPRRIGQSDTLTFYGTRNSKERLVDLGLPTMFLYENCYASVNCSNLATSKLLIALKFPLDNSENLAFVAPISPNTTLSTETDMRCPRAPDQIFSVLTDRSGVGHPLRSDIWSSENLTPEFLVADRVLIANYQGL